MDCFVLGEKGSVGMKNFAKRGQICTSRFYIHFVDAAIIVGNTETGLGLKTNLAWSQVLDANFRDSVLASVQS